MQTIPSILRLVLTLDVLAGAGSAWGQLPETWAAHYTNSFSYALAMTLDSDGNLYITGSSAADYGTVKFDASGNLAWAASYSGHRSAGDGANSIATDAAGNVYVTGAASGNRFYYFNGTTKTFLTDCVTVKYDNTGRQKWVSSYSESGSFNFTGRALAVDGAGNVYVAGSSFVVKYGATGHQTWLVTGVSGVAAVLDSSGNLYVTGGGTRKFDPNGNQLWSATFGGVALLLDRAGGVYVTGDGTTKKLDASTGTELWSAPLAGNAKALALDGAGNVFVAGLIGSGLGVAKYGPDGTNLWVASAPYQGAATAVAVDGGGNAYVTGLTYGSAQGSTCFTAKYDPNGNPLWSGRHAGTSGWAGLGLDAVGNVYVAGSDAIYPGGYGGAYLALKYVQPTATGMPQILTQPQPTLAFLGQAASFAVTAAGHGSLNYQWYLGAIPLVDSTNSTLSLTNVRPYSFGLYSVEVGDSIGLTLSTSANLAVVVPPVSQSVLARDRVEFDAWALGGASVTYQWQFNGVDLPGRTNLSLVLPNVTAAQAGDYRVVATVGGNSLVSPPAILTVETLVHQNWVARYNGSANWEDRPNDMKVDTAGNVYVTGMSGNNNTGNDYATVKYNADGRQVWAARYDGPAHGWDEARALALDRLGNVYVTGRSFSIEGTPDAATIKYGPNGITLWVARYTSSGNVEDAGQAVTVDDAGNVYVAVNAGSTNGGFDYVTVKYDSNGNQLWASRYDGPGHAYDIPHALAVDSSGDVYVTGESDGIASGQDYATLKYDPNGNLLWAARYNGPDNSTDSALRLAVDGAGNVYVSGNSIGTGSDYDITTIKYDSNGQQLWLARYNGPGNRADQMRAMALDSAGNVYVAGSDYAAGTASDYVTLKYSPNGQRLWVARYDGNSHGEDTGQGLALDLAGNVYVTGSSLASHFDIYGNVVSHYDYATIKYDSLGRELWIARFDNSYDVDYFAGLIGLDGAANVFVSGYGSTSSADDYVTVKYNQAANDTLTITGPAGFAAGGSVGGPFSVSAQSFTLSNQGTTTLSWHASSDASWLSVSPTSGLLATNQPAVTVTVSLNPAASNLNAGFYSATVWFTNVSNGYLQVRQFALAIAQSRYGGAVLALTPAAYWPLNETNRVAPADVVSNAGSLGWPANGFGVANPTRGQPGIVGQCFRFANSNLDIGTFGPHVDVPYHPTLNPRGAFSVELWAKPAQVVSDLFCAAASVAAWPEVEGSRFGWVFYQAAGAWEFRLGGGLGGYAATNSGGSPLIGAWNHLVGVYDGANASLYANGQLVAGPTMVSGFLLNTNIHIPLRFGATTFPNRSFDGSVDEVAFYTNVLGADRIAAHYNTASSNPSLYAAQVLADQPAGYWHLDEPAYVGPGPLPVAVNLGFLRSEADGIYQPGCLPGVLGVPGVATAPNNTACRLNGSAHLKMRGATLNLTGPFSVVLWVKAEPANGTPQTIVSKGTGSYRLWLDGSGHPHFAAGEQPSGDLVGPGRIDDGAWHQLAGVYDGINAEFLYVDGQLVASTHGATFPVTGNGNDLFIGSNPDVGLFQLFNGVVDEVCILTHALSAAQLQQLFAVAAVVPSTPPVFTSFTRNDGNLLLSWSAEVGRRYQVQYNTALTQSNWINLGTILVATSSTLSTSDIITGSQRFYRVVLLP
jgi:hypothetical protein